MPFGTVTSGALVVIDGVTYRPFLVDSGSRLVVALDVTAITPLTTPSNGQVTVPNAGVRVQLTDVACKAATIKALPGNSDNIYLGDSGVTSSNGHVLAAGDAVNAVIDNLNRFYIDADTNDDGISYLVAS